MDTYYPTPSTGNSVKCNKCPTDKNVVNCYTALIATKCKDEFYVKEGLCEGCPENAK